MGIQAFPAFFFLSALLLGTPRFASSTPLSPLPINLLRPMSSIVGHRDISCRSWRLAVETNNLRDWKNVPEECLGYIGNYMLGHLYRADSAFVVDQAIQHARSIHLRRNGTDIWVFDIDETTLSNLPYYAAHGFGAEPFNGTAFDEWVVKARAPALPESLRLFNSLLDLGVRPVFLTGRMEANRAATARNLLKAGYRHWEKLLLRDPAVHENAITFKSGERKKLVELEGYRIIGNIGDQWSDILGNPEGLRTFKLPDPMYYIG